MRDKKLSILPSTKVAELLDAYPGLENVLIGIAPPFKKLRNPMLRKSVAKVASLRQAAAVGRLPVEELVNKLRAAVGQEAIATDAIGETDSYFANQPDWFDAKKIVVSIDEREGGNEDSMPLVSLVQKATRLNQAEIVELITTFLPAPGIDTMKKKGFLVWSLEEGPELIKTYFSKPSR